MAERPVRGDPEAAAAAAAAATAPRGATATVAALLIRSPLFAAMPRPVVDRLAARATRRRARRGQRVLARSDAALVAVVTGRLELVADGAVIRSVVPPSVLGVSLAVGARASTELRAAEDAELLVVPADAVAAALRRDPVAAIAAIAHLAGVVAELSAELEALARARARGPGAEEARPDRAAVASTARAKARPTRSSRSSPPRRTP